MSVTAPVGEIAAGIWTSSKARSPVSRSVRMMAASRMPAIPLSAWQASSRVRSSSSVRGTGCRTGAFGGFRRSIGLRSNTPSSTIQFTNTLSILKYPCTVVGARVFSDRYVSSPKRRFASVCM